MTAETRQPEHDTTPPRAEVRGVRFAYNRGVEVISDVSLKLYAGKVHCMLGESGCGKSTLLRLLAGLERPTAGAILIDNLVVNGGGRGAKHIKPEHRKVGFVFQDYALFPHLSVLHNVTFGMRDKPRNKRKAEAQALLDRVGLADYAGKMPHTLSGGQQQRVALARALGRDPKLMLLDEPFTSLDATLRDELRDVTLRLLRESQVATLMVTHDPAEAMLVADTVSLMRSGRIVLEDAPEAAFTIEPREKGPPAVRLKA